jgi:hypothetical protein
MKIIISIFNLIRKDKKKSYKTNEYNKKRTSFFFINDNVVIYKNKLKLIILFLAKNHLV